MKSYYDDGTCTIYHAKCEDVPRLWMGADVMVTDPPFGIRYRSGQYGTLPRSIAGDEDSSLRDAVLAVWSPKPALVFGTWRVERPAGTHTLLVWDTLGALGMGDLSVPWKPSHQEVYVIGGGFRGRRTTDVLRYPPVQSMASNGRVHPHEKPVGLLRDLLGKCPPGVIVDPFMGSGTTLRAAKDLNRKAIGIEIEERYCEIAAKRLSQEVLALETPA
jgi:hypothetical protein